MNNDARTPTEQRLDMIYAQNETIMALLRTLVETLLNNGEK